MKFKTIFFVTIFSMLSLNSLNGMGMLRNYAASLKYSIMNKVSAVYNQIVAKPQQFLAARKIKNVIISGKSNEITALIQQNTFASLSVKDRHEIAQFLLSNFNDFLVKPSLLKIIPYIFNKNVTNGLLNELFLKMIAHADKIINLNEGESAFFSIVNVFLDINSLDSIFYHAILELCLGKFDLFLKNETSVLFLNRILSRILIFATTENQSLLLSFMQSHFLQLIETRAGIDFIFKVYDILGILGIPLDSIINLTIKHFDIIREKGSYIVFEYLLDKYSFYRVELRPLIKLIEQNILEFCKKSEKTIKILIFNSPESFPIFIAYIDQLPAQFLKHFYDKLSPREQERIMAKALESIKCSSIEFVPFLEHFIDKLSSRKQERIMAAIDRTIRESIPCNAQHSQTGIYLKNIGKKDYFAIAQQLKYVKDDLEIKALFKTVIEKEREFGDEYYTFIHGQQREYYWPERLFTFLYSLKKKQSIPHFFFAHVKDLIQSEQGYVFEKIHKNFLLNNNIYNDEARALVLFMNYAFFANSTNFGSNSIHYVRKNANSIKGTRELSSREPFKKLGYEHIYLHFKAEIEELCEAYASSGNYGNLLFIAVPKEDIHKHVYLGESGATKVWLEIEGIGKTYDIRIIMDNLLNHPERIKDIDQLEFCLIMTQQDGGLDPHCGIHIYPILTGDPEKLAELKKKEEALFAKIAQVIKHEQQQTMQAIALRRANILVSQMVPIK